MAEHEKTRAQVLEAALELKRLGFVTGSGGNVSLRLAGGLFAITPGGRDYAGLSPADISIVDASGRLKAGEKPSSETAMHLALYAARPADQAIVHTHQPAASVFAVAWEGLPLLTDEQLIELGPGVPLAPYHPSGSPELARAVAEAMKPGLAACLMASHGLVAAGQTLSQAIARAQLVEKTAQVVLAARAAGLAVNTLEDPGGARGSRKNEPPCKGRGYSI